MPSLRRIMDDARGMHSKCRSCVLGLRCLTGVVHDGWAVAAHCRQCGGLWVFKLRATVKCHLYPGRYGSSWAACPACRGLKDSSYIYGLESWDIPECADVRRKFFERRKALRRQRLEESQSCPPTKS